MRIARLSIDGFGIFREVEVRDLPPGLSLFLGDNEAGKSTILGFVHTVLFGYPDGRSKEKTYPPLNGGQAGGRLVLETDSDRLMTLERREGPKGGPIAVIYPDGRSDGQPALSGLLGGGTRQLYRNLYAFSLHELEQLESLTGEEIRDVIYGASLGASARSFPEARKRIQTRLDELFRPSGSKPEINNILKELEEARERLREAGKGIREYEELAAGIAKLDTRIRESREGLHADREKLERQKSNLQLWDDWIALQDAEARLAALQEMVESFPENGIARLDGLLGKLEHEKEVLRGFEQDLKEKREKSKRLVLNEALLEKGAEIRALVRRLSAFEQAVAEHPRAEERLKAARRQAQEVLVEFGAGWTEERVLLLDRSSMIRGRIEKHRESLETVGRWLERSSDTEKELRVAEEEAAKEDQRAREKLWKLKAGRIDVTPETLAELRERREQFHSVIRDLPKVALQRAEANEAFKALLRDINPAWTPRTLEEFDASLTARQRVTDIDTRLTEAVATEREARTSLERAQRALTEAEAAVTEKLKEIEHGGARELPLEVLGERKGRIRSLRDAANQRETLRTELRVRRQMGEVMRPVTARRMERSRGWQPRTFTIVAALLALLAGLGLWFTVGPEAGAAVGGVLLLVAMALLILGRLTAESPVGRGGPPVSEDDGYIKQLLTELNKIGATIEGLQSKIGVTGEINSRSFDSLEDDNAEQIRDAEELIRLRRDLKELEKARERALKEREVAVIGAEEARARREGEATSWKHLADSLKLPADTSPRTAGFVFEKAEAARGQVRQIADLEARLSEMQASRDEYLALMSGVSNLAPAARDGSDEQRLAALAEFLAEIDRQEEDARLLSEAHLVAERAAQHLVAVKERLDAASKEHRQIATAQREAREAWAAWLGEAGMDLTWSPETCLRLLDRAGRLSDLASGRDEAAAAAGRLLSEKGEYFARIATLCQELGRPQPPEDKLVVEVHALESSLEENTRRRALYDGLAGEILELESRCDARRNRIEELKGESHELVTAGGAEDDEGFRRRGRFFEERQQLLKAIETHAGRAKKISGEADLYALRKDLAEATLPMLRAALADVEERVAAGESALEKLQDERARSDERRKQLRDEDQIAKLRAQEESLLERFRMCADEWGRHVVALHLLGAAKERFEKTHQPEVLRQASRYFSCITAGRYRQIFAPHGEGILQVIEANERRKPLDALSRGTSEQLYLAIRFGYIASEDHHREKLPILMDDVLVNFDPTRASHAARGILEMAATHQVIYFTCHPETVEVFQRHHPEVPVYRLADAKITGPVVTLPRPPPKERVALTSGPLGPVRKSVQ